MDDPVVLGNDRNEFFRTEAQRMIETVRMYVLAAPEFKGFRSCQHWTTVAVFITREKPGHLWSMVEEVFSDGDDVASQARFYTEMAFLTPQQYVGVVNTAVRLLNENSKRWKFAK